MEMDTEPDFLVTLNFAAEAKEHLGWTNGPPKERPAPVDLTHVRYVQAGDFLRIEGMAELWVVSHRTWHLMSDQTVLKLTLNGPIQEDG